MVIIDKKALWIGLLLGSLGLFMLFYKSSQKTVNLSLFSAINGNHLDQKIASIHESGHSVKDSIEFELTKTNAEIIDGLPTAFNIDHQAWMAMRDRFNKLRNNDQLLIKRKPFFPVNLLPRKTSKDHPIIAKAQSLLAEYGIDAKKVKVYPVNQPKSLTNATAEQGYIPGTSQVVHQIAINIPRISMRQEELQEAILRHEIMHLIYYDPLELSLIEELFEKNGIKPAQYMQNESYVALNRHKETRADLTAASHSLKTAAYFKKNFEFSIAQNPHLQHNLTATHPATADRLLAINQLVNCLQAEESIARA